MVEIEFDERAYSIRYRDSTNLEAKDGQIHPAYNQWIESLDKAIVQCRAGNRLGDISHAVQTHCESHGFGVVRAFVGHGIGQSLHEEPQIPNFGDAGRGPVVKAGMVLAIEPMVTMGSYEVRVLEDRWTAVTVDGSWAAHFEDTIAITERGPEVLTRLDQAA